MGVGSPGVKSGTRVGVATGPPVLPLPPLPITGAEEGDDGPASNPRATKIANRNRMTTAGAVQPPPFAFFGAAGLVKITGSP